MKKLQLPSMSTISTEEFVARLAKKPLENFSAIEHIEEFFLRERGYVFKLPKPGMPVIHLVSGGVESTVLWGLMLEKYHLCVYPLFLRRGTKRWEKERRAVDFFSKFYRARYPKLFREPFDMGLQVVSPEVEVAIRKPYQYYHPQRILDAYRPETGISTLLSLGGFPIAYPFYGLSYASYLWDHHNVRVNHFFSGVAPEDGGLVASQTITALRVTMLVMSIASANAVLQFGSLAFEKEYGLWLEKKDLIMLGARMGLPLEYTWSCYGAGSQQCGDRCLTCLHRRGAFVAAGIVDKTLYSCDAWLEKVKRRVVSAWYRLTSSSLRDRGTVEETETWKHEEVKTPWKQNQRRKSDIRSQEIKKNIEG